MTQDQHGQAREPGFAARGDAVPDDETGGHPTEEAKPMTRFQKVASALRGDKAADQDQGDQGQPAAQRVTARSEAATPPDGIAQDPGSPPWVTDQDEAAMASSPISREAEGAAGTTAPAAAGTTAPAAAGTTAPAATRAGATSAAGAGASPRDYGDEPGMSDAERDDAVAVTRPDALKDEATEPDVLGGTARAGTGSAAAPYAEARPGAATIADVPAGEAAGTPGLQAAPQRGETPPPRVETAPAAGEMRPGEAAGALGDFSDLTYGNLIPDADRYAAQWQQIQFRFVDDPQGSVTEAADIVAQVTAKMEAAIQERQRAIEERQRAVQEHQRSLRGRWGEGTNADTEALRETLRMYKTFLDQLIGLRAS